LNFFSDWVGAGGGARPHAPPGSIGSLKVARLSAKKRSG
jgi:hypothetical protein